jgi:hypothetical protein
MLVWLLIMQICLTLLAAACAVVASRPGSASLRTLKRQRELEVTMSDLQSSFEALLESHKRLRSRTGMRELRARDEEQPVEDKKAIRRRLFGALAGPAFAARQASLDADRKIRGA